MDDVFVCYQIIEKTNDLHKTVKKSGMPVVQQLVQWTAGAGGLGSVPAADWLAVGQSPLPNESLTSCSGSALNCRSHIPVHAHHRACAERDKPAFEQTTKYEQQKKREFNNTSSLH